MATEESNMNAAKSKADRKRKKMLVKLLGVIALITVVAFVVQNLVVITDVRKQTVESTTNNIKEIAQSYIESTGMYVEGTMNELDVYTRSDVVRRGSSAEEIGAWLADDNRPKAGLLFICFVHRGRRKFLLRFRQTRKPQRPRLL